MYLNYQYLWSLGVYCSIKLLSSGKKDIYAPNAKLMSGIQVIFGRLHIAWGRWGQKKWFTKKNIANLVLRGGSRVYLAKCNLNDEEAFSSRNTLKKNFLRPQRELNPWPSRYRLDALVTVLWETRGEQGHILGSYMCDMCNAKLQGSTCRNDKCE